MADHTAWHKIPASHPALPGHFPGRPVVPAVVILSEVWDSVTATAGRPLRCSGWPSVKFLAPLLPDERFTIELVLTGPESARFTCKKSDGTFAQGSVHFAEAGGQ